MGADDLTGLARTARVDVLFTGYAADPVAGTVSLIRDGDRVVGVDPGMVPARSAILGPLEQLDPYAPDPDVLRAQRDRILAVADFVVPGHGPAFTPGPQTPR